MFQFDVETELVGMIERAEREIQKMREQLTRVQSSRVDSPQKPDVHDPGVRMLPYSFSNTSETFLFCIFGYLMCEGTSRHSYAYLRGSYWMYFFSCVDVSRSVSFLLLPFSSSFL